MNLDTMTHKTHWEIEKYKVINGVKAPVPYNVEAFDGNVLLNEGINNLLSIICLGTGTPYDDANAYIGVGDSSTAAAAAQTGLQAATNKAWAAMSTGYPQAGTSQQMIFKAEFEDGEAEFAWNEFSVGNASADAGQNLNRKVSSMGTKGSGEYWAIICTITMS